MMKRLLRLTQAYRAPSNIDLYLYLYIYLSIYLSISIYIYIYMYIYMERCRTKHNARFKYTSEDVEISNQK